MKNIINKKAYYNYYLLEKYNAGMKLSGKEIKAIRNNKIDIYNSYCYIYNNEIYIYNLKFFNIKNNNKIKLLLFKKEINKIKNKITNNKNLTIIPTKIFISNTGFAKIEIFISKRKKKYNKKEIFKKQEKIDKNNINNILNKY
ncbi:MAG: hypothetical protein RDO_1110 [Flavobacteriales endosymbiont of Rhyzopertha dominica]|nr:MAG: SsrA-binding protein [Candidatus Shikimatogenerans bostrichidophilus]